jgi:hypothetical protein
MQNKIKTQEVLSRIKHKLDSLANRDRSFMVFGAKNHRYQLKPKLTAQQINSVETEYCCRLPNSYRSFLASLGNGGAGPGAGLFPLARHDHFHTLCHWKKSSLIGNLAQAFPHTTAWNLPSTFWDQLPNPDHGQNEDEEDQIHLERDALIEQAYWSPHIMNGAIPICHHGCAIRTWLVITGPMKDTIWEDFRCNLEGIKPVMDESNRYIDFLKWYEYWLDESLKQMIQ